MTRGRATLAFVLRVALVALIVVCASPSRADVRGPEDEPCEKHQVGDACDDGATWPDRSFRGECVVLHFSEGRSRMRCRPKGAPLTDVQSACLGRREGEACERPSGATGACKAGEVRKVEAFGGKGESDLAIPECKHVDKPATPIPPEAFLVVGGVVVAAVALALYLRRGTKSVEPSATDER